MNKPPEENDPPVRAELAANDVADTVTVIREWYDTVHLVGVSWGTNICGRFVTRDDPAVASLVQCAPIYRTPYDVEEGLAALGLDSNLNAYYTQGRETVEAQQGDDANTELFEAIWQTQVDSNQGIDENRYIAQAGALADYADCCADDPPTMRPISTSRRSLCVEPTMQSLGARTRPLSTTSSPFHVLAPSTWSLPVRTTTSCTVHADVPSTRRSTGFTTTSEPYSCQTVLRCRSWLPNSPLHSTTSGLSNPPKRVIAL